MGTRSTIAIKTDTEIKSIYCHWDGYLSYNGQMLLTHYNSEELARKLIDLGNLSSLNKSIEKPEGHSFNTPVNGYTVAYGRDRGEVGQKATKSCCLIELTKEFKNSMCAYLYLYDCKEKKWKYWSGKRWISLTKKNTQSK